MKIIQIANSPWLALMWFETPRGKACCPASPKGYAVAVFPSGFALSMACQGEVLKSGRFSERRLVEAAGVEPASANIPLGRLHTYPEF